MKIRKIMFAAVMVSAALWLISCSHDNPPFPELSGTRRSATNIAAGVLIDIRFGEVGENDVWMTYYLDTVPYEERGPKIDTTGNRSFGMYGVFIPLETETDRGEYLYGYDWELDLVKDDGSLHYGSMYYDNRRMYLQMDGTPYPMRASANASSR